MSENVDISADVSRDSQLPEESQSPPEYGFK